MIKMILVEGAVTLTRLYLEERQRRFLAKCAKAAKTSLSTEVRRAIDVYQYSLSSESLRAINAYQNSLSPVELDLLDAATKKAAEDIAVMNEVLEKGLARAERFFAEIEKLKTA